MADALSGRASKIRYVAAQRPPSTACSTVATKTAVPMITANLSIERRRVCMRTTLSCTTHRPQTWTTTHRTINGTLHAQSMAQCIMSGLTWRGMHRYLFCVVDNGQFSMAEVCEPCAPRDARRTVLFVPVGIRRGGSVRVSGRRVVRSHRGCVSEALRREQVRIDALGDQELHDGLRPRH